ncbi:MAG TPA: P-type conjugative transfer protein VirB9 [Gammaproteobacteria bacterium]|nr:P-type conjugative transfer protein VirB9 [Gammaproteobacteria bacterium]
MKKMIALALLCLMASAHAEVTPRGTANDPRIKVVMYDPNNVVLLKERYGYQTQISFGSDETIQSVSVGDSSAWQVVPVSNNLFIKPVAVSKTNMTVLTNQNSYNFQLDSTDNDAHLTYKLQFTYPAIGYSESGQSTSVTTLNPENINWKYSFTGNHDLAPFEAFDDGKFTYLRFREDGMSHLPAVFIVDQNKNETLVNYHMQGDYMVINSVARQFTLRDGSVVTSVYNDYAIGDWKKMA